uniref:Lectin n=1 Tax=Leucomphalos mildbraedii TaxID=28956 RepID=LEC_LEUMI|nr:RecName: Full=Lectin; AltName: Full=Agglutinin; AltName: Full=BMA; Contains: RecName: Full=Lectin beta chain; Contains: RecName: Full=Lectin alpha chain [Leucomphalos mildbraedii]
ANSVCFTFTDFESGQQDLIFQGDASVGSNKALQLTKVDSKGNPQGGSVGRALYTAPIRLWQSSSLVASFETTFTFSISQGSSTPAAALTFFIASPDTKIPSGSGGRLLGLFGSSNNAGSDNGVVAVEFDTYPNTDIGDPNYRHIGIDVNSIRSKAASKWDWQNGKTATAHISYNSASKRLSVVSSYPNSSPVVVSFDVELNNVGPPDVRVGFSATTGQYTQTNNILAWSFRSSLMGYQAN